MDAETRYPVHLEQDVVWGEQDKLGHVNNVAFFRYFENARIAHFQAIQMPLPVPGQASPATSSLPESSLQGPILASTHCDFLRPLVYPDRIRIEVGVPRLGNSSFVHHYRIYSYQQQAYVARGQSVTVFYDYATQKSVALPEDLRRAIQALEES